MGKLLNTDQNWFVMLQVKVTQVLIYPLSLCILFYNYIILVPGFWSYSDYESSHFNVSGFKQKTGMFGCQLCEKRFETSSSLCGHMKVHQGKTTCNVCGKVLATTTNLKRHMKSTHPGLNVKNVGKLLNTDQIWFVMLKVTLVLDPHVISVTKHSPGVITWNITTYLNSP